MLVDFYGKIIDFVGIRASAYDVAKIKKNQETATVKTVIKKKRTAKQVPTQRKTKMLTSDRQTDRRTISIQWPE